jgi:hypothetical protein
MRKIHLFHLFVLGILLFAACGKDICPYVDEQLCDAQYRDSVNAAKADTCILSFPVDTGVFQNGRAVFPSGTFDNVKKTVMLEYFTGFRCANCPPASATAHNIKHSMCDDVVLVSYHVTSTFAAPIASPPAPYSTDLRTTEGEALVGLLQFSGLPIGNVNRMAFGSTISTTSGSWIERIDEAHESPAKGFLRFRKAKYIPASGNVEVALAYRLLDGATEDYNLVLGAMEHDIIEAQKDGSEDRYPYAHDYVFRANFNGTFGEELTVANPAPGPNEALIKEYTVQLNPDWSSDNIVLFAYLQHRSSGETIQATEARLQ